MDASSGGCGIIPPMKTKAKSWLDECDDSNDWEFDEDDFWC
jgi:hypothetical protein